MQLYIYIITVFTHSLVQWGLWGKNPHQTFYHNIWNCLAAACNIAKHCKRGGLCNYSCLEASSHSSGSHSSHCERASAADYFLLNITVWRLMSLLNKWKFLSQIPQRNRVPVGESGKGNVGRMSRWTLWTRPMWLWLNEDTFILLLKKLYLWTNLNTKNSSSTEHFRKLFKKMLLHWENGKIPWIMAPWNVGSGPVSIVKGNIVASGLQLTPRCFRRPLKCSQGQTHLKHSQPVSVSSAFLSCLSSVSLTVTCIKGRLLQE